MTAEAWPTEAAATVAVEAAARKAYEDTLNDYQSRHGGKVTPWEQATPALKLSWRDHVLPVVWAALQALPDPRYAAWEEGREGGYDDAMYEERGVGANSEYPHKNPYPSGL